MRKAIDHFNDEELEVQRILTSIPKPTPPDGGRGWIIVFSSFFMNFIVDGICYSYGILLPELVQEFGASPALLSLGGALLLGTYMMSGPVACALCNKLGSRQVALLGCLISVLSLILSLATDMGAVFVTVFGILGGFGFGLMFLSSVLLVGLYFDRNRGIAASAAMCGSSAGMAVLAPLTRYLIYCYDVSSAILLLAGFVTQGFILASLLKPVDADVSRRKKLLLRRMEEDKQIGPQTCIIMQRLLEEKHRQRTISTGSLNNGIITHDNILIKERDLGNYSSASRSRLVGSRHSLHNGTSRRPSLPGSPSVHTHTPPILVVSDSSPASSPHRSPNIKGSRSRSASPNDLLRRQVLLSQSGLNKTSSMRSLLTQSTQSKELDSSSDGEESSGHEAAHECVMRKFVSSAFGSNHPMNKNNILYTGSVQHLAPSRQQSDEVGVTNGDESQHDEPQIVRRHRWKWLKFLPPSVLEVLDKVFDSDTCRSPTFLLLTLSSSLTMFGYYIPFLLLPVKSYLHSPSQIASLDIFYIEDEESFPKAELMYELLLKASYLLTILGCSNTVGRILAGFLGTKSWVDGLILNNIALLIAGGSTMAVPFCTKFQLLALFAVIFGACVAAFSSLRSILVVELIGVEKLTTCFNQMVIFHGLAVIAGTPITCYLCQIYDSFDVGFYIAGGLIFISGLVSMPLRKISEWERRRNGELPFDGSSDEDLKKTSLLKPQAIEMVHIMQPNNNNKG